MSLEFWQRLLAAEASRDRLERVRDYVRAGLCPSDDPRTWPGLSKTEVDRAVRAKSPDGLGVQFIEDPVPLFALGQSEALERPRVAIVGTRRASSYGKSVTEHFAQVLSHSGCTIVSGGAIGIDATAHEAAIMAGGTTACVLPCGVDVAYPPRHIGLFRRIQEAGCLLSPFACFEPCTNHRLMARNKIVAELAQGLIVIEAPLESGSLITARYARELDKPVFVVPGPVTQDTFAGSHQLIREGAQLVDKPEQVLAELGIEAAGHPSATNTLSGDELLVHQALSGLGKSPEALGQETGLSVAEVLTALTMLEIEGIVQRVDTGYALRP